MDAYASLGVSPAATDAEIKQAYRRALRTYHPDFGGSEQDSIRINDAYSCIRDADRRALYDRAGRRDYDPSTGRHDATPRSTASTRARSGGQPPRRQGSAAPTGRPWAAAAGPGNAATPGGRPSGFRGGADPFRPFTDPWGRRWASFQQFQRAFLLQYDEGRGGSRIGPVVGFRDPSGELWASEGDYRRARTGSDGSRADTGAEERFERRLRQQTAHPPDVFDLVRDREGHLWASVDQYRWAREEEELHDPGGFHLWTDAAAYGFRAPDGVFWASERLWRAAEANERQEQQRQAERLAREADEMRRRQADAERARRVAAEERAREERLLRLRSQYLVMTGFRSAGRALGAETAWIAGLVALVVGIVVVISTGAPAWTLLIAALAAVGVAALWWLLLWLGGRLLGRILSGLTDDELRELR